MKKTHLLRLRVILVLSLMVVFSGANWAVSRDSLVSNGSKLIPITNSSKVRSLSSTMGASEAEVYGVDKGVNDIYIENPYDNETQKVWAGTFYGKIDNNNAKFYCIDIQHPLAVNDTYDHKYTDNGITPPEITYIMNNYYPHASLPYSGSLSETREAAAVQLALWHFADGLDETSISISDLRQRATNIINDANQNAGNSTPLATLVLEPMSQTVDAGALANFVVRAYDIDGNTLSGISAAISTTSGTLSTSNVVTGASGASAPFTLSQGSEIAAFVTAVAQVTIPQGTRYVHATQPDDYQKLVLATPTFARKSVTANVTWGTGNQLCALDDNGDEFNVGGFTVTTLNNGDIKVTLVYSKGLNDNTYGDNAVNWPGDNHKFKHLVGSDRATFSFSNGNGAEVLRFDMDYFSESNAYPSGYGTTGIDGKDGNLITGNGSWVVDYNTSLTRNFNDFGYILTDDSPESDDNYTPNPSYPNWIFEMIYEVTISQNAFGSSGFGGVTIVDMHNSPSKLDVDNSVYPYLCDEETDNKIGDFVWHDSNVNGIQDDGPNSGIEGVEVELYENGSVIATTFTNSVGYYEFTGLLNGTYEVKVASSNYQGTGVLASTGPNMMWNASPKNKTNDAEDSDADKNEKVTVVLDNNDDLTIDFGFFKSCVTVTKTGPTVPAAEGDIINFNIVVENCGDATLGGGVDLTDPLLGFSTNFALAQGEVKTFDKQYTVTQQDCDNGFVENTVTVVGHPKDIYNNYYSNVTDNDVAVVQVDCGVCTSMIGDYVWHDKNVNGIQDEGELGIENVTVELYKDGVVVFTTVTNSAGYYEFDELENGDYKVLVADANFQTGGVLNSTGSNMMWNASPKNKGTNDAKDSDANKGEKVSVSLDCEINNTIDFGFFKSCVTVTKTGPTTPAAPGEEIMFHFVIENCGDATLGGGVTLVDALLNWTTNFTLASGETKTFDKPYIVKESDCDNGNVENYVTVEGHPKDAFNNYYPNVTDDDTWIVPVDCGSLCDNTLGDFVWHDANVNGIQDNGELGIEGVVVELYKGGSVVATSTTNATGFYEFTGLNNDDYEVKVANANFEATGVLASTGPNMMWNASPINKTNDADDSDADKGEKVAVTLDCNDDLTIDFGFFKSCITVIKTGPTEPAAEGDIVNFHFEVENCGDAILGGGVDLTDPLLGWTTNFTLAQGEVKTFDKTYTITQEDCDNGFVENTVSVVGHPKDAYNTYYPNVSDDDLAVVQVNCGVCTSMIGDFVWHDTNVNGVQDEGELGIEDVIVELYKDGNLELTTLTNSTGYYEFDPLENGVYEVLVADANFAAGGVLASTGPNMLWNASPKDKGSNDAKDSDANIGEKVTVSLDCEVNNTIDFGFFKSCVTVTKTGPTEAAVPGDEIMFHIVVENCGDATLGGGVTLVDALLNWSVNFTLAKGEIKTFDKPYTVLESDCENGNVENYITAEGHPKDAFNNYYPNVTDDDTWTVPVDCSSLCNNELGDFVWHDADVDGIQNDGPNSGLEGVLVQLLDGTTVVDETTTDATGFYSFYGFPDGTYTVKVANSNFNSSGVLYQWYGSPKDADDDDIDSDGDITTHAVDVTFNCEENPDVDFGFFKTCVSLVKTGPQTAEVGETITYHFVLENCGDIVLHGGAQVYDDMLSDREDGRIWDGVVEPGDIIEFDKTYTVTDEDCGDLVNEAHVIGHPYMQGRTFANVTDNDSWTVAIDCTEPCVEDWTGTLGPDETLCEYEPQSITVDGSVTLTPDPSRAKLVKTWRLVYPSGPGYDNTLHSFEEWIDGSTTVSITGEWPGITPDDTEVRVRFSIAIFDCDDNQLNNEITKDIYWTPEVCPPPPHEDVDIEIEKTSSELYPEDGDQLTFTITATNNGPADASGVVVTDLLPEGFDYVSDNPSQGSYNDVTGDWTVGSLANGAIATLTITVTVDVEDVNNATFDLGVASDYNLFVLYDLNQPSADTQGKVAVGRDANLANYSVGDMLPAGSTDVLVVGRYLVYESGHVYGDIVYGDTTNLPIFATSYTGTLSQGNPINFAAAKTYLENLSTQLGGYTSNGLTEYKWNGVLMSGTDPFLNVFDVDGDELTAATWAEIEVPNGSVVLVNISGTDIEWSGGLDVKGTAYGNVLYNYYEAEAIEIQGIEIRGSVLAPFAHVQFNAGVQEGQMICKSLSGPGQFNYNMFVGNIPSQSDITNIATLTAVLETDLNGSNNSSSVTVHVNGEATTGDGSAAGDDGSYWQQVNSFMTGEIVYSLVNDNAGNVLAGTWGGKIYRSPDGENWTRINNTMYTGFIWTIAVNSNGHIFAGTEQGIYRSTDNGASFVLTGLVAKDVRSIVIDSFGDLYAGVWGDGIFKSIDNGATWNAVNNGLTNLSINSLVVNSKDEVFAAAFGAGVFKSGDFGANWYQLNVGYDYVWTLGVTSTDMLFAGTYGDGLYRSGDDGNQWGKVNDGLNAYYIYSITVDADNHVYVSSWASGVFVSTDAVSSNFQTIGLGGIGVSSIVINPASKTLYAGTSDGAIYKKVSSITDVDDNAYETPTEFNLAQNYPNPFNPSTTIQFTVPAAGKYSMKIFNILGQEVATLFNKEFNPGAHNVDFNAAKLASGIYLYQLTGDNVNITKKMILMK